ncbi:MAG: methyltransferase [Metallosphaera sp.]|uniref:HemK2/MTQ2 family protein methyltransferase n=1 Tax=Metallosphaera sp. TaxID=2020860 RepID=UPI003168C620
MDGYRYFSYLGYKLCLDDNVYEPAEDSELLASILDLEKGESVLDVGSGSGILGIVAHSLGARVISVDINPFASLVTQCSARLNNIDIDVLNCDLTTCLRDVAFDSVIFNPPYLPVSETSSWIGYSWSGGIGGLEQLNRLLLLTRSRKYYFVYSSFTDEEKLFKILEERSLKVDKVKEIVVGFEILKAVKVIDKSYIGRT